MSVVGSNVGSTFSTTGRSQKIPMKGRFVVIHGEGLLVRILPHPTADLHELEGTVIKILRGKTHHFYFLCFF